MGLACERPPRNPLELGGFEGSAVAVMDSVDRAGRDDQGLGRGGGAELEAFRLGCYGALTRRADALFEIGDALLCPEGTVTCPPRLSLTPVFRRGWGECDAALPAGGSRRTRCGICWWRIAQRVGRWCSR